MATVTAPPPAQEKKRGSIWRAILSYLAIIVVTLIVVDVACMALGLFPPAWNPGDPDLGWRPAPATGSMDTGQCYEFSTGTVVRYPRNEDGIRTSRPRAEIESVSNALKIAVTGDSHTELCMPNEQVHSAILEAELNQQGIPAITLLYGAGKYSPLQGYLAFRKVLKPYNPQVLVLNLYTGNDFYDLLRVDDRPHFERTDDGYRITEPEWFLLDDPARRPRSRVLFVLKSLLDRTGVRRIYFRVVELQRLAKEQGGSFPAVIDYIKDIWRAREPSIGYPDAFTAQILNQQLFFHHFPSARDESLNRLRTLMKMAKRENPGLTLVMSAIPSYQLAGEQPVDSALLKILRRLPISYEEGVRQEQELYEQLRVLSAEEGWLFVDNLKELKALQTTERLYNDFDYHILPVATEAIGKAQARELIKTLRAATDSAAD